MAIYLLGAYQRIEANLLNYLTYIPLRRENINISSQRLADFIPIIYSLLSKAFNLITFGEAMSQYHFNPIRLAIAKFESRKEFDEELLNLFEKKSKNRDFLNDYYTFHNKNNFYITDLWLSGKISEIKLGVKHLSGVLEYDEKIKPFEFDEWNAWNETRNALAHRDQIEASLKVVFYGIGGVHVLLDNFMVRTTLLFSDTERHTPTLFDPLDIRGA